MAGPSPPSGQATGQQGFTMLVVLVVCALGALASASLVAAVLAASATDAADRGRDACAVRADGAVAQLVEQVRWGMVTEDSAVTIHYDDIQPAIETTLGVSPGAVSADGSLFTVLELWAGSRAGRARVARRLAVRVRPGAIPHGLASTSDLAVFAPTEVYGCGVYVGGDVVGREWITFGEIDADSASPDLLHPDLYSLAAVHAGGAIYTAEGEVHDLPQPTLDTDVHVGEPFAPELSALPAPALLAGLRHYAVAAGEALEGATLHVDRLPLTPPAGADAGAGFIVYVAEGDREGPLRVTGERLDPPAACPLVVIVEGDVLLGDEVGQVCAFRGALLATGALCVAGPARLAGSLAGRLVVVDAPLRITLDGAWLSWPPAGCRSFQVLRRW